MANDGPRSMRNAMPAQDQGREHYVLVATVEQLAAAQAFVKKNFEYVIFGIIIISALPAIIEFLRARQRAGVGSG